MRFLLLAYASVLAGCSSAGPYGYSRTYTPLDDEQRVVDGSREFDPVMAERVPEEWKKTRVNLFGVVKERVKSEGGAADLTLGLRVLAPRNLCDEADSSTCRVTVSAREHAEVHVIVRLRSSDDVGRLSVQPGSLVRVVGVMAKAPTKTEDPAVIRADYYRQWPRGEFVTMADSEHMRR